MSTSDQAESRTATAPGRRRLRRIGGVAALCGLSALVVAWAERRTIATAVIDRTLAEAHVSARYRVVELGLGRQRLVNVVIGDPPRPDLTADWVELGTRIGLDGAQVTAVRAGGLRVRGTLASGKVSFGALDRLLPRSSGAAPFRLPVIDLSVTDARLALSTPAGDVAIVLTGDGRLDDGFTGRVTVASGRLAGAGCTALRPSAAARIRIRDGAVSLSGPLRAERFVCAGSTAERITADLAATLAPDLAAWRGSASARADHVSAGPVAVARAKGRVTFAGSATTTAGEVALTGGAAASGGYRSRGVSLAGRYLIGAAPTFAGDMRAIGASLPAATIAAIGRSGGATAATPLGPLTDRAARALARAASDVDLMARVGWSPGGVSIVALSADARSGAGVIVALDHPLVIGSGGPAGIAGIARVQGGNLPTTTVRFARSGRSGAITGVATLLPYAADGARLALAPVRFTVEGRRGRAVTSATLSGPLQGGRVDGLRLPLAAAWDGGGVQINPACADLSIDRLAVSTLRLDAVRLPLCPTGPALVRVGARRVEAGARIPMFRVAGTLGSTPLTLTAQDTRLSLGGRELSTRAVAVRLGEGEAATRLDIDRLVGAGAAGLAGRFERAAGRIGKVPLHLSGASGDWRFADGALALTGTAIVADTAPIARFRPLRAEAMALTLAGGTIDASARLVTEAKAAPVGRVVIAHDLGTGRGSARVDVPRLAFDETFQPDDLTPLTYGVIADVRGAVGGEARIDWDAAGARSTGTFGSDALDLAAAFGPVRGLAGKIRFTDLLALESAPDQVATVASINPGVPVTDGRIVFRTLAGGRIGIASARWPFAAGTLELLPTMLDFGSAGERRLTFALTGVDAGRFLQQFEFGNVSATGTFDGTLPMIFDADGGRIEGGRLRVRAGGGNIAYLGELTRKDLGTWGNVAFQALRSIDYRRLSIEMNGPLAGEMITEVRFAGVSQGNGARSNFLIRRLQTLPFVFNIRIRAPFRGLIDSAQSFYDPTRLIVRNLPALMQQQNGAVPPTPSVQPEARNTPP